MALDRATQSILKAVKISADVKAHATSNVKLLQNVDEAKRSWEDQRKEVTSLKGPA